MTDKDKGRDGKNIKRVSDIAAVICLLAAVLAGVAIAQETFIDDFEDGDVDGWENKETGTTPVNTTDSIDGNYSLFAESTQFSTNTCNQATYEWTTGPTLDLTKSFTVRGTVKQDGNKDEASVRIGLPGDDQGTEGQNAFLIFDDKEDITYLDTHAGDIGSDADRINTSFPNEWTRWEITSEESNKTLKAKIWSVNHTEPNHYQLTRSDFDDVDSGPFGVNVGCDDGQNRQLTLDAVKLKGTEEESNLTIESKDYVSHGESIPYEVFLNDSNGDKINVTGDSDTTVTSSDPTALSVNTTSSEFEATTDTDVNKKVTIEANHTNATKNATKEITVATKTVDNLTILPTWTRLAAIFGDGLMFLLILATLTAIVAARVAGAFAGVGILMIVIVAGWFGGWASAGMAMIAVFSGLFIGFNLAANIDYTVQR